MNIALDRLVEILSASKPLAVTLATAIASTLVTVWPSAWLPEWLIEPRQSARPLTALVMLVTTLFFVSLWLLKIHEAWSESRDEESAKKRATADEERRKKEIPAAMKSLEPEIEMIFLSSIHERTADADFPSNSIDVDRLVSVGALQSTGVYGAGKTRYKIHDTARSTVEGSLEGKSVAERVQELAPILNRHRGRR